MSFHLHPFAISNILILISCLPLCILIFSIKEKTNAVTLFGFHLFAISIWGLGALITSMSNETKTAFFASHLAFLGVIFISVFFLHSTFLAAKIKKPFIIIFAYAQAIFFTVLLFNGKIIQNVKFNH